MGLLLDQGADVNATNVYGNSALSYAALKGAAVRAILERPQS
jgi:ankyrin repeat protein